MPSLLRLACVALLCVSSVRAAFAQAKHDFAPFITADRSAEVTLARTGAAPNIGDSATVLVFTRTGYVQASHGTNGFTCLVMRGFTAHAGNSVYWDAKNSGPACFNAAASKTVLPAILKQVDWLISGMEPAAVDARVRAAYAKHEFPMPAEGAVAYMLSHSQHLANTNPHWYPHLMFFFSAGVRAEDMGSIGSLATVLDGSADQAGKAWPVLTLLVPVRRWSDGTFAGDGAGH